MLRPAWFSKPMVASDDVVSAREFGRAAFVLLVEYQTSRRGYRIKVRVKPRNREVAALIERHQLRRVEVYIDPEAKAVDERQAELGEEAHKLMQADGLAFIWGAGWWVTAKQIAVAWQQGRVVRVSLGSLLDGIEIKGEMEELRRFVRELTQVVDRLAAQIDTGAAFDNREVRIFAPGSKVQPVKGPKGPGPLKPV